MKTKCYNTFEEAYQALVMPLSRIAACRLFNADFAIDAVQDAFVKVVENIRKRPGKKISTFILQRETVRACRRLNKKFGYFLPANLSEETEC